MNTKYTLKKRHLMNGISYLLSAALTICLTFSAQTSFAQTKSKSQTIVENGITYTIEETSVNGELNFLVTASNSQDKTEIEINDEEIIVDTYDYQGENLFGKDKFDKSKEVINIPEETTSFEDFQAQAIKYGSKTTASFKKKFWYAYGSEGKYTYLKIGHTASYRIRTDNLSSTKDSKCDQFTTAIKNSNSSYAKAKVAVGGSGALFGIALGLVSANMAFPPTIIISIIVAAIGGGASIVAMANHLIDTRNYYKTASERYDIIKTYGVKL